MAAMAGSGAKKRIRKKRRNGVWRRWFVRLGIAAVLLVCGVFASIVLFRFVNPPITATMIVDKLRGGTLHRQWVPLEKISPNLQLAVIASEDGNFCRHRGVDWGAVREVITKAKSLKAARGASTIPMQVAKNLYLWERRNYVRKVLEVPLAYAMTSVWPKQRMLEVYLNIAQWGPDIYGAEVASRRYFRKPASRLNRREAVLLAISLPNPYARNPARPSRKMLRIANAVERRLPWIAKQAGCVSEP
jgi:monofunctional biosynthetic peptidoglycan transglycosylase